MYLMLAQGLSHLLDPHIWLPVPLPEMQAIFTFMGKRFAPTRSISYQLSKRTEGDGDR